MDANAKQAENIAHYQRVKAMSSHELLTRLGSILSIKNAHIGEQGLVTVSADGSMSVFNPLTNAADSMHVMMTFDLCRGYEEYNLLGFYWQSARSENPIAFLENDAPCFDPQCATHNPECTYWAICCAAIMSFESLNKTVIFDTIKTVLSKGNNP